MEKQTRQYLKSLLQAWLNATPGTEPVPVGPPAGVDPSAVRRLLKAHHVEVALGPFMPLNFHTEDFRQSRMQASQRTAFLLLELERILPAITWEDCRPVVLKGAALAPTLYPDPLQRWFLDLDILVPRRQLDEVCRRLEEVGYRHFRGSRDPKFYEKHHFHRIMHGPQGSVVEVHWDLTTPDSVYSFDVEGVFDRALPARLGRLDVMIAAPVDQVLHGVYQNIADGYIDLRRVMDMGLLMQTLTEEDWLYLVKESRRVRMGTAFMTWLHVVKLILGKEPPGGIPRELVPGWATRRTLQGLDVAGGLLERSAEQVDGYSYLLHLLFTPNTARRLREIKRHLLPGEMIFMDGGLPDGQKPPMGKRVRLSLYYMKHLLLSGLRAMRALFHGSFS
jgi:hypothetical protein